jgi:hypothetical protein
MSFPGFWKADCALIILAYRNPVDDSAKAQNVPKIIATFKGYDFE